ncbi:MAG: ArgE/DapE family deacylase [Planctomycetota bacterium]|jgi:acetylornithine deacetylase|nr:ArgE/DapE family deacylase [Planctomycetota bacterium]
MDKSKQRAVDWLDSNRDAAAGFLSDLIRIPSVNPWFGGDGSFHREGDAQRFVAEKMRRLGAKIDLFEPDVKALAKYEGRPGYYEDRDFTDRPNLAATVKGSGGGNSLMLAGHIDVVPPGEGWTEDPFSGRQRDGVIFGRGAVDMKGGVAAMITGLEAVLASGFKPKGDVIVATVVEEESGGMGSLAFVDRGYKADAGIMTESTGMTVAPLCRGILWGRVRIEGRSGHIELPQGDWRTGGAVDAIDKARLILRQFDMMNRDWALWRTHPLMALPCQILAAQFEGGEYPTAFANSATITFNAQYLPGERDEDRLGGKVKAMVEEQIRKLAETDPWLALHPPRIEWMVDADCAEVPSDHPFVGCMTRALADAGVPPRLGGIGFHTDMGWYVNTGTAMVNFGPGDPRLAHQPDERLSVEELTRCAKSVAGAIIDWCGVE